MSAIAKPISDLLKKDRTFAWKQEHQDALNQLVDAVTSAPVLAHFNPEETTHLYTDASKYAIGGWLGQKDTQDKIRPVVFYSRKMTRLSCPGAGTVSVDRNGGSAPILYGRR
jgi:hypothetical protein